MIEKSDVSVSRVKDIEHIVVVVKAKIGSRDDNYKLSATESIFAKTLSELITRSIRQSKKENVTLQIIKMNDELNKLFKKSESNKKHKEICAIYQANKVFAVKTWRQRGGGGIRDVKYYLYDCLSNIKIKKLFEIEQSRHDTYLYQAGFINSVFDFIELSDM